jgi:hypothetical protein
MAIMHKTHYGKAMCGSKNQHCDDDALVTCTYCIYTRHPPNPDNWGNMLLREMGNPTALDRLGETTKYRTLGEMLKAEKESEE